MNNNELWRLRAENKRLKEQKAILIIDCNWAENYNENLQWELEELKSQNADLKRELFWVQK